MTLMKHCDPLVIEFVGERLFSEHFDEELRPFRKGQVRCGDRGLTPFHAVLDRWSEPEYEQQWAHALHMLRCPLHMGAAWIILIIVIGAAAWLSHGAFGTRQPRNSLGVSLPTAHAHILGVFPLETRPRPTNA